MNVGIIGAGTMGIGIAQVAATNGCKVWVYDANPKQVETATVGLEKTLTKLVDKQKISAEKMTEILANISIATELKDFKDCELIIEAIIENKEIKTKVFTELEQHVSESCVIGSNTSSISITSLGAELQKPERFIGIHFFNPAPLMPLVEVIPSLLTEKSLAEKIYNLMKNWG
ncbi:MAG: 3-hydroxybutyryl-CoA dehydrogenase, partial [Chryseobacterium sp.]